MITAISRPKICKRSFDAFPWRDDPAALRAWQRGQTGYPIVDAGMRQLWHTGWMHNRVRMVVASFLVKHLLIDWRRGEQWFWDTLVDADPASNPANWQWVAGSGADAAPYFRIFNPVLQGEKFDPDGAYVARWYPRAREAAAALHASALDGAPARTRQRRRQPRQQLSRADGRSRVRAVARARCLCQDAGDVGAGAQVACAARLTIITPTAHSTMPPMREPRRAARRTTRRRARR